MRIVQIFGKGVVGEALGIRLQEFGHEVHFYDPNKNLREFVQADVYFICVPVPPDKSKILGQNLINIESCLEKIESCSVGNAPILIRSSVTPGTCDELSTAWKRVIIAFPEFLTERKANKDMSELDFVVGGDFLGCAIVGDLFASSEPKDFRSIWQMSNKEAEMAKFTHNCFGALKVTFFNLIHNICEREGMEYENVLDGAIEITHFINREHTSVPGPDGDYGYGGKCFPENVEAMEGYIQRYDDSPWDGGNFFTLIKTLNNKMRKADR